jgi:hypothetical protein
MAGATSELRQGSRAGADGLSTLRERLRAVDAVPLLGVPAVLVAVFALPWSVRTTFVLSYLDPTPATAYTAHFVHLAADHLLVNLVVYLAVVPVALGLSTLAGRRRQFYVAFATILLAFPFALSALNVLLVRPRVGFGFSGINMAFLGFLPHALLGFLAKRPGRNFRPAHSPLLFFVGTAIIAFWAVPPTAASLLAGVASLLVSLAYVRTISGDLSVPLAATIRRIVSEEAGMEFVLAGVCLFVLLPFTAFPHRPVAAGSVLNLFAHLLGFCFGYIVPYVAFRFVSFDPVDG